MKNEPRTVHRSWDEVKASAIRAAAKMKADGRMLNGVYGVPRGGACLAVLLSHILKVEFLDRPREGCLICDDIADTGNTLLAYKDIPGVTIYTDVAKETSKAMPHYYGMLVPEDSPDTVAWFVFPWEYEGKK